MDDDRDAIARCLQGDEAAFADLFRRHEARVLRMAYALLGDREAAEDAKQEAFLAAFRTLDRMNADVAFSSWVHRNLARSSWMARTAASAAGGPAAWTPATPASTSRCPRRLGTWRPSPCGCRGSRSRAPGSFRSASDAVGVLLIRHGSSTWNLERRWQGWADPPLSADGVTQTEAAAAALRGLDIRTVVSSDLARARSTAEIIARVAGVEVSVEPALRERDVGLWTGLTSAEIESRWPGQLERYRADPEIPFPDGEGAEALVGKAMPVLLAIARQDPQEGVAVVVSHGGLIRCARLALGGTDRPVPGLGGCWLEARGPGLQLVADADSWLAPGPG